MNTVEIPGKGSRQGAPQRSAEEGEASIQHYLMLLLHRKWLVLGIFFLVAAGTAIVVDKLPNVYSSETLILVDPQQVPDNYVHPTVSGDVRNRLGTLSQQILSATRLQKVIDTFNLYPDEKKSMAREDVIALMRNDIVVKMVSDSGDAKADLQAFRISYSGKEPRIVAQVTNELASLFIEENLKAREQMATGTSDFMENQLEETKKQLEAQEATIRDFKLKHLGEMPEQQGSNIQILGQLQARLQLLSDDLNRAQEQKSYLQNLASSPLQPVAIRNQNAPQNGLQPKIANDSPAGPTPNEELLAQMLMRYGENHPDVKRLKMQVEEEQRAREEADQQKEEAAKKAEAERKLLNASSSPAPGAEEAHPAAPQANTAPTIQSQLSLTEAEIAKDKQEQEKLVKDISTYQARLEAVPVREQETAGLIRDYAISKEHYSQLLEKKLSAEMATQLEIRQKGEKFTILDPAQVAGKPSKPKRLVLDGGGAAAGLLLGLLAALSTEFVGGAVTSASQVSAALGVAVLGIIPMISTPSDRRRKRWMLVLGASGGLAIMLAGCAFLLYRYRGQLY